MMTRVFYAILIFSTIFVSREARAEMSVPIKILIVPGHDSRVWGAQYGTVKEAHMNLAVGKRLHSILKKDKRFEIWMTRNERGYAKEFSDYFALERESIISFRDEAKKVFRSLVEGGFITERKNVPHVTASEDTSVILYGINKWANENKMDAVVHIHFNDYPRDGKWTIGEHTGFAIYFPDEQKPNGFISGQLAADIFLELDKKYNTSTYEKELGGLIADQKLIALGSSGTLPGSVRSVLVEYGYIYEKKFRDYTTRHKAYDDMAKLTAKGIENHFFGQ